MFLRWRFTYLRVVTVICLFILARAHGPAQEVAQLNREDRALTGDGPAETPKTGEALPEASNTPESALSKTADPAAILPFRVHARTLGPAEKLTDLDKAYLDAFNILVEDNACSRFFGGPSAVIALNEFTPRIKIVTLDPSTAIRMRGDVAIISSAISTFSYRSFEKIEINLNGPFFKSKVFPSEPEVPRVGYFSADTREARVTILLHELGHLIRTGGASYLLRDDGKNSNVSRENTLQILTACGAEIRKLENATAAQQLVKAAFYSTDQAKAQLSSVNQ